MRCRGGGISDWHHRYSVAVGRLLRLTFPLLVSVLPGSGIEAQGGVVVRQVLAGPGLDIDVTPSADGRLLAFASSRSGSLEIWMRAVDGGPIQQITTSAANSADRFPSFTPDGRTIVFQSDRTGSVRNIWLVEIAVRALAQLTTFTDGGASHPALSPDAKTICFTRTTANGSVAIWLVGIDGRAPREIAAAGVDCAWTPDGRIVFARPSDMQSPQRYDIWITGAGGDGARALSTSPQRWSRNPVPSPDGNWIAYTAYESTPLGDIREVVGGFQIDPRVRTSIWLAPLAAPDGPHRQIVTGSFNSYMSWTRDARALLFTSTRSGSADIWSIDLVP